MNQIGTADCAILIFLVLNFLFKDDKFGGVVNDNR